MNDRVRRGPAGDGVARWFAGAQRGIGERAAKSRLHRARRALAALLGQPELRTSA